MNFKLVKAVSHWKSLLAASSQHSAVIGPMKTLPSLTWSRIQWPYNRNRNSGRQRLPPGSALALALPLAGLWLGLGFPDSQILRFSDIRAQLRLQPRPQHKNIFNYDAGVRNSRIFQLSCLLRGDGGNFRPTQNGISGQQHKKISRKRDCLQ